MVDWFLNRLDREDKIRVLPTFADKTVCIDIETTGLGPDARITTIALYARGATHVFVAGRDLPEFLEKMEGVAFLLTYNGTSFDLPLLRKRFGIDLAIPHLDLRYVLAGLGLRGGQKEIEKTLGFRRGECEDLSGEDAVVSVLIADRVMKEEPWFLDLVATPGYSFTANCELTFYGHESGNTREVAISSGFVVTFFGYTAED